MNTSCFTPRIIAINLYCHSMSPTGSIPVRNAVFGEGIGPIFLDNLMCEGHENSLLGCVASEDIGTHNCEHSEDAGVRCEGT